MGEKGFFVRSIMTKDLADLSKSAGSIQSAHLIAFDYVTLNQSEGSIPVGFAHFCLSLCLLV